MKQNAFAWGFILFFVATFIAIWGTLDFYSLDIWSFIFLSIPSVFLGLLNEAIGMLMAKNKKKDEK